MRKTGEMPEMQENSGTVLKAQNKKIFVCTLMIFILLLIFSYFKHEKLHFSYERNFTVQIMLLLAMISDSRKPKDYLRLFY